MAEIYFSSDPHFHHANFLNFKRGDGSPIRDFPDVAAMNRHMVERHNLVVPKGAKWYSLGDVTLERDNKGLGLHIIDDLNGVGRLILGNHDHYHAKHYLDHFEKVLAMQMLDGIRFTHIPIHPGSMGRAIANVHGHIHEQKSPPPVVFRDKDGKVHVKPYINLSMEAINYTPVTLTQVKAMIASAVNEWWSQECLPDFDDIPPLLAGQE